MQKTSERGDAGAGLFSLGDVVKVMVTLAALGLSLGVARLPKRVSRWALPVVVAALLV